MTGFQNGRFVALVPYEQHFNIHPQILIKKRKEKKENSSNVAIGVVHGVASFLVGLGLHVIPRRALRELKGP